jgi:prevent-host-death family protein
MRVGIKELRDGLSRHLSEVRAGATVTITDHGRPVARIVPVAAPNRLEQLIAEGRITEPVHAKRAAPDPLVTAGIVSDLVDDQRR